MILGMPRALFPAIGLVRFTAERVPSASSTPHQASGACRCTAHRLGRQGPATRRAVLVAVAGWVLRSRSSGSFRSSGWRSGSSPSPAHSMSSRRSFVVRSCSSRRHASSSTNAGGADRRRHGGPRLGDLEHGGVASFSSPEIAIVSGGIACVLGVIALARKLPHFVALELDASNAGASDRGTAGGTLTNTAVIDTTASDPQPRSPRRASARAPALIASSRHCH